MRYFQYNRIDLRNNDNLKDEYIALIEKEKSEVKKDKKYTRLSLAISTVAFILYIIISAVVLLSIPTPDSYFITMLILTIKITSAFVLLPVGIWLMFWGLYPSLEQRFHANYTKVINKYITNSCPYLRAYYGLEDPYIVTKCYDSSDRDFKNSDICIFIVNDELHISPVLVNGFFNMEREVDCYAFMRYELGLAPVKKSKLSTYELRSGDTYFILDKHAKKFFDTHYWVNV